jgi:hypothetical protein
MNAVRSATLAVLTSVTLGGLPALADADGIDARSIICDAMSAAAFPGVRGREATDAPDRSVSTGDELFDRVMVALDDFRGRTLAEVRREIFIAGHGERFWPEGFVYRINCAGSTPNNFE